MSRRRYTCMCVCVCSVCTVVHKVIKSTSMKAWEKQATNKMVRVFRSSPDTLQTVFGKFIRRQDLAAIRSDCTCTQHIHTLSKVGTVTACKVLTSCC